MQKSISLSAVLFLVVIFGYAGVSLAYDVSYSSSTPSGATSSSPAICPANSTLNGTQCYCNAGYIVSAGSCVKDSALPVGSTEIYTDVLMSSIVNDDKKCELIFTVAADIDMCNRYRATPANQKDTWKSIPRPAPTLNAVTNPWAPASAQTLSIYSNASSSLPANLPPPPPAPPAVATTTPATSPSVPPPPPTETAPASDDGAAAQALAKLKPTKFDANVAALKQNQELAPLKDGSPAPPPEPANVPTATTPAPDPFAQIAGAGAANPVDISTQTPGLMPLALTEAQKIPESVNGVDGFEKPVQQDEHPGFFSRIFHFLFGWI